MRRAVTSTKPSSHGTRSEIGGMPSAVAGRDARWMKYPSPPRSAVTSHSARAPIGASIAAMRTRTAPSASPQAPSIPRTAHVMTTRIAHLP